MGAIYTDNFNGRSRFDVKVKEIDLEISRIGVHVHN